MALLQQALSVIQGLNVEQETKLQSQGTTPKPQQEVSVPLQPNVILVGQKKGEKAKHSGEKASVESSMAVAGTFNPKLYCHRCYGKGHLTLDCCETLYCDVCDLESRLEGVNRQI